MTRTFIIGSTIVADAASKAFTNAINDPEYVENHIVSWKRILGQNKSSIEIDLGEDSETLEKLKAISTATKYSSNGSEDWSEKLLNSVISVLKPILEPVSVDYSNELLAKQIYGVSVFLFILSVLILILLIAFIIQILIYSDKIMSFFSNKYIRWYIQFNKKILGIEVCFLGISLVYFMYLLSYGIHFIATHPITIT